MRLSSAASCRTLLHVQRRDAADPAATPDLALGSHPDRWFSSGPHPGGEFAGRVSASEQFSVLLFRESPCRRDIPLALLAQDSAALFKTKCAIFHGDLGRGKPPTAPKIAGTNKNVADVLTKGGEPKTSHVTPMSALTPDQVTALAAYVKTLK
jgi:cytochrome c553